MTLKDDLRANQARWAEAHAFKYKGYIRIQKSISKFVGSLLIFFCVVVMVIGLFLPSPDTYIDYIGIVFAIPFLLLWTIFGMCFFPNIAICPEGLSIEFVGKPLLVSWEEVVNVQRVSIGWLSTKKNPGIWLVKTKALTPLHRFFGFIYGNSTQPGFLIGDDLENYELLLRLIREPAFRKSWLS